jgi:hypothetical protein
MSIRLHVQAPKLLKLSRLNLVPGFESRQGQEIFLFSKTSRPARPPPIQWVREFFAGGKTGGALS